jgi:hypothetical protein
VQGQLVKLLENGPELNSNLKLVIVAGISFAIGVLATNSFNRSDLTDPVLTSRQKELQEIAIEAEHRPFFPVASPVGKKSVNEAPVKTAPKPAEISVHEIDYLKLTSDIREFQSKLEQEAAKKFDKVKLYERAHIRKKEFILSKMDYFKISKNNWYKASFNSFDTGSAKFTFYMNFYNCGKNNTPTELPSKDRSTLNNSCFVLWCYTNLNGKWNFYSVSSNMDFSEWRDDVPYLPFNMEEMGELPKETNILRVYVPIADAGGPISFLKYEGGKFEWIDAGELRWVVTNAKEAEKFQKIATKDARNENDHQEQ